MSTEHAAHHLLDEELNDLAHYAGKKLPRDKTVRKRLLALKSHLEVCEACRDTMELNNSARKNRAKL